MAHGDHAVWFELTSERFDHSAELPPDANAGNRFYGRDVAELVSDGLAARGWEASFLDEDWGWQAHGRREDGSVLEVSVYHNPEEDPATEDDWALMVRLLRKEKFLGVLSRFGETEVDSEAVAALEDVFRAVGVELRRKEER